ncbi:hypothetical protein PN462_09690 [Spirulina sp. CS-785/01]|uniref:hypothetical protein n=1 Tax=Spirulina sp. CS-785/01 TaxID=3021716 RepID=UPI00232B6936|nr:hypothetical protein [Spirulina sp. CS-785/01]MDB9313370.1 hypothetical protein [Spirulina sp. CS-785/01]
MKLSSLLVVTVLGVTGVGVVACQGSRVQTCTMVEIEDAEFEVDVGDVDIERGEVEMNCGRDVVDVRWTEIHRTLKVDPGQYKDNISGFQQQVTCYKDSSKKKEVMCKRTNQKQLYPLPFSYDD